MDYYPDLGIKSKFLDSSFAKIRGSQTLITMTFGKKS